MEGRGVLAMGASFVNEALDELDLEYALSAESVDYKTTWGRSGKQLNIRTCPFCGNRNHKVYVNADTGLGNCFAGSCSQGTFNKWQLLKALMGLSGADFKARIAALATEQGWRPIKRTTRFEPGELELPPNVKVKDLPALPRYLLDRGLTPQLADYFDLRLCESGKFKVKGPDGKIIIQDYANRVIIPIYNLEGEMISFQGRDITGTSEKRYLFPPLYSSTGSHLYNIHNWDETMDAVLICEGPFDVIGAKRALDELGIKNILPVGSFGMTFSVAKEGQPDQLDKLLSLKKRGLKKVYFLWDNEPAAIERAIEACVLIGRFGLKTKLCVLDTSKDPGEAPTAEIGRAIRNCHPIDGALKAMMLSRRYCR